MILSKMLYAHIGARMEANIPALRSLMACCSFPRFGLLRRGDCGAVVGRVEEVRPRNASVISIFLFSFFSFASAYMPVAKINLRRPKHPPSRLTSRPPCCQSSSLYFSSSIFFGETQRPLLLARIASGKLGGSPGDWGGRMRDQNAQSYRRLELCPERGRPDHGPRQMCLVSPY